MPEYTLYINGTEYAEFKTYFEAENAIKNLQNRNCDAVIYRTYYGGDPIHKIKSELMLRSTNYARINEEKSEKRPPMVFRLCNVVFPESNREYSYSVNRLGLVPGDIVIVPVGEDNKLTVAKVISVDEYTAATAPYPIEKTKLVVRKATSSESEVFAPKEIEHTSFQAVAQHDQTEQHDHTEEATVRFDSTAFDNTANVKNNRPAWWIMAAVAILAIILIAGQQSKSATTMYTEESYSYSGRYSSTPTCPPVNRERAMTDEEAERLKGTGYHNTRPNSSAEMSALRAAQVRCKNCGYHSDNGSNSLCDYCAWMERYGGGLPVAKAPDVTPQPTQKPTPRQTTRPRSDDDPYHASDYVHPDDFYYEYYDDFVDYEEAEEYWERYH